MARQRRRIARPKPPNLWVILFQIVVLVGLLFAILSVTDTIGDGTSGIVEYLTTEDLDVAEAEAETGFPGQRTDDSAPVDAGHDSGSGDGPDSGLDDPDAALDNP